MRVYNRKDFLALPEGTLFCQGEPWAFSGIQVKGETWGNDFLERSFDWVDADDSGDASLKLEEMLQTGASYPMGTGYGRDGMFNEDAVFLVHETADLVELKTVIENAILVSQHHEGKK